MKTATTTEKVIFMVFAAVLTVSVSLSAVNSHRRLTWTKSTTATLSQIEARLSSRPALKRLYFMMVDASHGAPVLSVGPVDSTSVDGSVRVRFHPQCIVGQGEMICPARVATQGQHGITVGHGALTPPHGQSFAVCRNLECDSGWSPFSPGWPDVNPEPSESCRRADGWYESQWWNTRTKAWGCRP